MPLRSTLIEKISNLMQSIRELESQVSTKWTNEQLTSDPDAGMQYLTIVGMQLPAMRLQLAGLEMQLQHVEAMIADKVPAPAVTSHLKGYRVLPPITLAAMNMLKHTEVLLGKQMSILHTNELVDADITLLVDAVDNSRIAFMLAARAIAQPEDPYPNI